jgi:glucokinase
MEYAYDDIILAGDVGGTNANLALVGRKGERYEIAYKASYRSQKVPSILEPLARFRDEFLAVSGGLKPSRCCVSGAGPVKDGYCGMSNVPWGISRAEVEDFLGVPTVLINDFKAVSYGICLLDVHDPGQIAPVPHTDGRVPEALDSPKAVVGAGTGLGVGYIVKAGGRYVACDSEGGHSDFAAVDEETEAFGRFLRRREGIHFGAELAVSGQGIANLFDFLVAEGGYAPSGTTRAILNLSQEEKPAAVAAAESDPLCARAMELFVRLYARFAANAATFFYPKGGLYLAGGIIAKNEERFLRNDSFMKVFEVNYKSQIHELLASIPVYIVKDYSISLYGAAYAAVNLET